MEDKTLQIGKILSLSSTKTRGKTISSLVESILYSYNEELDFNEILELIHNIFAVKPFADEVRESIQNGLSKDEIVVKENKYTLSTDKYNEIYKEDLKTKSINDSRFERFQLLFDTIPSTERDHTDVSRIWTVFTEYLYECFYQYGENAVGHLRASDYRDDYNNFIDSNPFRNALDKLTSDESRNIFKKVAILFIKQINHEDLEYLESLAQKTIAFHSLGLPKELYDEIIDLKIIDWTIYVDTNFLFSVLNLHRHPENKACEDLLLLVRKENLNIRFKYTSYTLGELKQKRAEFEELIPKGSLHKSHISALLQSGRLDSYSEAYYENLLENSEATLHPTEVIDFAERTIQSVKKIGVHNSKFENLSDEYINSKVSDYQNYIALLNSIYVQRGLREFNRFPKQLYHDMLLREIIEYLQRAYSPNKPTTMSEVKFLGVTLDKLLIKYDRRTLSQQNIEFVIPNFYLPSYLLSKLYRLLPVQADDYKKAFISAIATFSFSQSTERSREVQKFVNYYRNLGLIDENILISFIANDFFLDKFFDNDTQKDDFFESEMNKKISDIQNKFDSAQIKLTELENAQILTQEEQKIHKSRLKDQESIIDQLKDSEKVLSFEIKKIQKKTEKSQAINQLSILDIIEDNTTKKENERLKAENEQLLTNQKYKENEARSVKRENYINSALSKWRRKAWLMLVPFLVIIITGSIYELFICNWNIGDASLHIRQTIDNNFILTIIIAGISVFLNIFVGRFIYDRYHAHNNIKAYIESIKIPDDMKSL